MKYAKIVCVILACGCRQSVNAKSVEITGPILAPWVKGQVCAQYWFEQKRVQTCFDIQVGQKYVLNDVPNRVEHVKITRSFYKNCSPERAQKNKCRKADGKFFIKKEHNVLDLTYKNNKVLLSYDIPPQEPQSNFGRPQGYGPGAQSIIQGPNYLSQPDGLAV